MNAIAAEKKTRKERKAKHAARNGSHDHADGVVRASLPGGTYKPLSDNDVEKIYNAALRILEEYGLSDATPSMRKILLENGAKEDEGNRILFPRTMVDHSYEVACREFSITGLDGKRKIELGGEKVNFGGNSYTVQIQDLETREYRSPTLTDLYDLVRLEDTLDNLHYVRIPVIAQDIEASVFDINSAYAVASATGKPFSLNISFEQYVEPVLEMFDMMAGGPGEFAKNPFCLPICVHAVPPLKFGSDSCFVIEKLVQAGVPIIIYSAGMSGTTSPAALAGMLAQSLAECLAGLVWINLLKPGHPTVFGLSPLAADLRSGACAMGAAEQALMEAASSQIANYLNLPGAMLSGTTDSKTPDIQAGWERSYGAMTIALAGANHIGIAAGGQASNMGMSPESLVIDNDNLGSVLRILRGIEVTEETLSVKTIGETVHGEGHFLGHAETMELMKTEYYYPALADRDSIEDWDLKGRANIVDKAHDHILKVLDDHYPQYISAEIDAEIRRRFDIRLPEASMKPSDRHPLTTNGT
jgi:trimethylamine--corrinoid protein Co-methyltransferase